MGEKQYCDWCGESYYDGSRVRCDGCGELEENIMCVDCYVDWVRNLPFEHKAHGEFSSDKWKETKECSWLDYTVESCPCCAGDVVLDSQRLAFILDDYLVMKNINKDMLDKMIVDSRNLQNDDK